MIRGALILGTGFALGTVYTLRHSTDIVDAMGDLRDEVVKAFSEQEDPEPLKKLLEYIKDWDDKDTLVTLDPNDDSAAITAGDIRSLSVNFVPTEVIDGEAPADHVYPNYIILEKLGAYAKKHGIDDAGMIEFIDNITKPDETPKEITTT